MCAAIDVLQRVPELRQVHNGNFAGQVDQLGARHFPRMKAFEQLLGCQKYGMRFCVFCRLFSK